MTTGTPKGHLEGERRFATVLFADIAGFTVMSQKTDPETVAVFMNRCFELLEEKVHAHGGHVDKYIGDCIMALFGVPKAVEHAPAHAVRAALEMMHGLTEFLRTQELGGDLGLHVGINSGLLLAGEVGGTTTRDFTVLGDTVNLASRLKEASPIGEIWVGPETYRYTRDEFDYEPLRPRALKGREGLTRPYRVLRRTAQSTRRESVPSEGLIFSSLVGRERELRLLAKALERTHEGAGGVAVLAGEAGIGKSRLLNELTGHEMMRDLQLLAGTALAVGRTLPFHPFVDLFRRWAGMREGEADHEALARLEAAVGRVAPAQVDEMVPFLATMMGFRQSGRYEERLRGIEGDALEKLIQKAIRELLQAIAHAQPLVVMLEDFHWADSSSVALLEALFRLVHEAAVLFLIALRTEISGPVERLLKLARRRFPDRVVEVALEPLSATQCDILASNLLHLEELPPGPLRAALRKAEGNPFFIEEVVRALIDEGAIEYRQGQFRLTDRIDSVVIPGTIQEVIMSRVDQLPEPARYVAQVASVIGRSFRLPVLADILADEPQLEWALALLKTRQLTFERRGDGEVEYVFKHAVAQETIYESILQRTRTELHADVAQSIETLFTDRLPEFYGMLAYHYSRAERLEKAEEYLFKAGDEAARAAASSEALSYFQEASRLYFLIHGEGGDPARKALLEKNIGLAILAKGNHVESIPHFNKALACLGEPVPQSSAAVALYGAVDLLRVLGYLYFRPRVSRPSTNPHIRELMDIRYNRAKAQTTTDTTRFFLDTIASICRLNHADPRTVDEACGMYAGGAALFSFSGLSFAVGARFLDVAHGLVRPGNVRDVIAYEAMKFIHHFLAGDWSEAHLIDPALLDQGLRYGLLWDVSTHLGLGAERAFRRGEYPRALAHIERVAKIADVYDSDFARSHRDGYSAALLLEQRRLDEALSAVQVYYSGHRVKLFNLLAKGWEARIRILRGERDAAAAALAEAEKILARQTHVPPYHRSAYAVSRLLFDVGALEEAQVAPNGGALRQCARRARRSLRLAIRNAARVAIERPATFRLAGRVSWLLGGERKARLWWERAFVAGERLGALPELARTHREVGSCLGNGETLREHTAAQHLERARKLFTELGLAWDLEQVDATASLGANATARAGAQRSARHA